jgi:hypothetical protein
MKMNRGIMNQYRIEDSPLSQSRTKIQMNGVRSILIFIFPPNKYIVENMKISHIKRREPAMKAGLPIDPKEPFCF